MPLLTPLYDLKQFPSVYEPSEDTFLFIDALEKDLNFIKSRKPTYIAEVGCGSGVVITSLAVSFENACTFYGIDINPLACLATQKTANLNCVSIECLNMDLLSNFKPQLMDVLLFNPPYVVTDEEDMRGVGLNRAWAGGKDGRQIIDRFLSTLASLLSDKGVCYMVVIKENNPDDIKRILGDLNFKMSVVLERRILGEHLFVLRFCKK